MRNLVTLVSDETGLFSIFMGEQFFASFGIFVLVFNALNDVSSRALECIFKFSNLGLEPLNLIMSGRQRYVQFGQLTAEFRQFCLEIAQRAVIKDLRKGIDRNRLCYFVF